MPANSTPLTGPKSGITPPGPVTATASSPIASSTTGPMTGLAPISCANSSRRRSIKRPSPSGLGLLNRTLVTVYVVPAPNRDTVGLSISEVTKALPEAARNNGYAAVEITTRNAPSASAANSVGCRRRDAGALRQTGLPRGRARIRVPVVVVVVANRAPSGPPGQIRSAGPRRLVGKDT